MIVEQGHRLVRAFLPYLFLTINKEIGRYGGTQEPMAISKSCPFCAQVVLAPVLRPSKRGKDSGRTTRMWGFFPSFEGLSVLISY